MRRKGISSGNIYGRWMLASGWDSPRFLNVGSKTDASALRRRHGHEFADGGEHGGDGLVVGIELLLNARFDLVEAAREVFVGGEQRISSIVP
jgi:hypothetical protein